jgi:hypothetical protein
MQTFQRVFLTLAVTCLAVGIVVTVSHGQLPSAWTLALPTGAVCLGLFLISLLLRRETEKFDADQDSKGLTPTGHK